MNYDEIALNLINGWEGGDYRNECQRKAQLQCLIIDALKNAAFSSTSRTPCSIQFLEERQAGINCTNKICESFNEDFEQNCMAGGYYEPKLSTCAKFNPKSNGCSERRGA